MDICFCGRFAEIEAMTDIICMAAIGKSGQIGLDGKLPWPREKGDLPWFREQTMGGVLIMGVRTISSLPKWFDLGNRILITDYCVGANEDSPENAMYRIARGHPGRTVFVCGGAKTYRKWATVATRIVLTRVDYDGPADTWFPFDAYWSSHNA
jgi:dihydrofolate reductase